MRPSWFAIRKEPSPGRSLLLKGLSFLLPLAAWCVVSYVPFVWHPLVRIADAGDSFFQTGTTVDRATLAEANGKLAGMNLRPASGVRENPVYFPAPHRVATAFYAAFATEPLRKDDPWLHQSLAHSFRVIVIGFGLAVLVGLPLGVLCGTFPTISRMVEPVVDFVRYMPPPVFGALAVAILGLSDAPKVAIIFIGTVFCMVRVVANTTRQLDPALLEAAMTLGANRRRLLLGVIVPGILPNLYNDVRILLGAAWTLLTVAELIGVLTGITFFIDRQGKYFRYENVYAGIIMIGLVGLLVDKVLTVIGARLFPWQGRPAAGLWGEVWSVMRTIPARRRARSQASLTSPLFNDERLTTTPGAERSDGPDLADGERGLPARAEMGAISVPVPMQIDAVLPPVATSAGLSVEPARRPADAATA